MKDDRDIDERADDAYDTYRQRQLEARLDGIKAGRNGWSAEMNPYLPCEPEYNEWHHGRLKGIAQTLQRRYA